VTKRQKTHNYEDPARVLPKPCDDRNFVRRPSTGLCETSANENPSQSSAIRASEKCAASIPARRWIAADALRELKSEAYNRACGGKRLESWTQKSFAQNQTRQGRRRSTIAEN